MDLQPLVESLESHANSQNAIAMQRYMRGQFSFYGIKTPLRRQLLKQHLQRQNVKHPYLQQQHLPQQPQQLQQLQQHNHPENHACLLKSVEWLWQQPQREYQYIALDLLQRPRIKLQPSITALLQSLIISRSWWDTVDPLAINCLGPLLRSNPELQASKLSQWRHSDNLWLRRSALLFQLKYKSATNQPLLFSLIRDNTDSQEFFIQKAIGWALRELSKTDPQAVVDFVSREPLPALSRREALKWLQRHPT